MPVDHIRYDLLTQDALRDVILRVLADAATKGLPGDHHFFITFDTRAEGVRMSPRLRSSYPGDMTIVLQHQFWDLAVGDDNFEVGLAFNGIPERLFVPLKAVKGFFDPSVQFGLQFTVDGGTGDVPAESANGAAENGSARVVATPRPEARAERPNAAKKLKPARPAVDAKPAPAGPPAAAAPAPKKGDDAATGNDESASQDESTSQVVRLDRFRKK